MRIIQCITDFCKASGMKINWKKTLGMFIGKWANDRPQGIIEYMPDIKWVRPDELIRYLGIWIREDCETSDTFDRAQTNMNHYCSLMQANTFTLLGRIITANICCISKLIYAMSLTYTTGTDIKKAASKINRFCNGGKKLTMSVMILKLHLNLKVGHL